MPKSEREREMLSLAWAYINLEKLLTSVYLAFGEGNGTLLQYSCLENPMDRGAW